MPAAMSRVTTLCIPITAPSPIVTPSTMPTMLPVNFPSQVPSRAPTGAPSEIPTNGLLITELRLINAGANPGVDLGPLTEGQTIVLGDYGNNPSLSIQAITMPANDPSVKVEFIEHNPNFSATDGTNTDNGPPYGVNGATNSGKYTKSNYLSTAGPYKVTATIRKSGVEGNTVILNLDVQA